MIRCTKRAIGVTKLACIKVKIIPCLFCNTAGLKNGKREREIEIILYLFIYWLRCTGFYSHTNPWEVWSGLWHVDEVLTLKVWAGPGRLAGSIPPETPVSHHHNRPHSPHNPHKQGLPAIMISHFNLCNTNRPFCALCSHHTNTFKLKSFPRYLVL